MLGIRNLPQYVGAVQGELVPLGSRLNDLITGADRSGASGLDVIDPAIDGGEGAPR